METIEDMISLELSSLEKETKYKNLLKKFEAIQTKILNDKKPLFIEVITNPRQKIIDAFKDY